MVEAILKYLVPALQQAGENAGIGHIATGKQQGPRPAGKLRQCVLQLLVQRAVAANQVRGAAADPVVAGGPPERRNHPGMGREAEIIVAAEIQVLPAVQLYQGPLG